MTISTTAKATAAHTRDRLSGVMIFITLILALLDTFRLAPLADIATLCAWSFVALEFTRLTAKQRLPIYLLLGAGCCFVAWAWAAGAEIQPLAILGEHLKLAMLLAAVNFIRLSTRLEQVNDRPGTRSFLATLGGMHVLSSVANFSSMLLVGEQLKRKDSLSSLSQIILARGFGLAILWSPFLSSLPLVLEQVPGTNLYGILPFTLGLTLFGLLYTLLEARYRYTADLHHYQGYPMTTRTLVMPACLVAAILLVSGFWPSLPTVGVVALLADVTTAPTLMAIAYIIATSVSMSGSLFSGVNFILQARFNCSGRTILSNNLAYSVLMLSAASILIYILPLVGIQ
jgi:hypothetical protein